MALPASVQAEGRKPRAYGVAFGLFPGDATFAVVVERAPDVAGAPDLASVERFHVPPGSPTWVDHTAAQGAAYHYRFAHVRAGYQDGRFTPWFFARPDILPPTLPVIPPEPNLDFDLYVDPVGGAVWLVVNGSPRVHSVRWEVTLDGTFASSGSGVAVNTDDEGDAEIATGVIATPASEVSATVTFYEGPDGTGAILGTLRRRVRHDGALVADPTLDEDNGSLGIVPG
ncbi:MAG: hypothetical protein D6701_14500, partial [Gemmatimonadetes bacterium]